MSGFEPEEIKCKKCGAYNYRIFGDCRLCGTSLKEKFIVRRGKKTKLEGCPRGKGSGC